MAADYHKISRYSPEPEGTVDTGHLPRAGKRAGGKIDIVRTHEVDPNQDPDAKGQVGKRRQRVAVNRNTDALERETSYGRLSPAAYRAGGIYQRIIERSCGATTGGCSMEPSDGGGSQTHAIAARMDDAASAVAAKNDARKAVGEVGEVILTGVLGERKSFRDVAVLLATKRRKGAAWYASKGGTARVARLFRDGLEDLAKFWDVHGEPQ